MSGIQRSGKDMPDVPDVDFIGALCEIWSGINYAGYHLAYVRVYLQTAALQVDADILRKQEQALRDMTQFDVVICRAHLAAFFWQLDHVFEALQIAVRRGQKEHPEQKYFWSYASRWQEIEGNPIRREISAYRNKGHEIPAIIGCAFDKKGGKFLHHFLPSIIGHSQTESVDINVQLQKYFEFVANVWLAFAPSDLKARFPRSFMFPVSVPHSYLGDLPAELEKAPQLQISIEAYDRPAPAAAARERHE